MADHLTEEEQIEALKNWWNEYWKSVVVPIVAAALAYSGWNIWQDQKQKNAEAGAVKYDELVKLLEVPPGAELAVEKKATAEAIAKEIVDEFSGSLYSNNANLILARLAVEAKDLSAAQAYLQRVADKGVNTSVRSLAKARLARVMIAQSNFDGALALVSSTGDNAYKSIFAEIRGDALVGQSKADAAKTAFEEALDNLPLDQFSRRSILQMKIDGVEILAGNVQVSSSPAPDAESDAVSEEDTEKTEETKETEASAENS